MNNNSKLFDIFDEDDLLPISLLQHLIFCERRAALVYNEQIWAENVMTVSGSLFHEKLDHRSSELRGAIRIVRSLRIRSLRLGLVGVTDVVEFHSVKKEAGGVPIPAYPGFWRPFPVEYKSGHLRAEPGYIIQLCAQALCLEEMLQTEVPAGAIFYGQPRRRHHVDFTPELRRQTEAAAARLHELTRRAVTPQARYEKKCRSCSLVDQCLPKTTGSRRKVADYLLAAAYEPPGLEEG